MLPKYVIDAALRMRLKEMRVKQLEAMAKALTDMFWDLMQEVNDSRAEFREEGYDLDVVANDAIKEREEKKNA